MPPDLKEVARPLAVPCPRNRGGTISASLIPPRPTTTDENIVSRDDKASRGGEVLHPNRQSGAGITIGEAKAATHATPSVTSKFYLTPALRATFSDVGATAKAYSFKEILGLLKAYLYGNRHLFDPEDILYVNCANDVLGEVLKVDRFHYNEVRALIAKHVIPEHVAPQDSLGCGEQVTGSCVSEINSNVLKRQLSADDINHERTASSVYVNPHPYANGKTFFGSTSLQSPEKQGASPCHSVAGPSRLNNEGLGLSYSRKRRHSASVASYTVEIPVPKVPEGNSDSESVYSYQGYETAYCRNTEFEDTDEYGESEFEEYELASDDDGQEMERSDDSDSVIEDIHVAVLALHALDEDELEEDFWADDSDIEEHSTDDDPELSSERWDCLTCGIKNKPFVRYCGKCWQLRKNWLPERPKKKRRKPRPKKKLRRRTDSVSYMSATDYKGSDSVKCEDSGQDTSELVRTSSTATTVSVQSESPTGFCSEQLSSQDSGICLSQDNFTESSQDIGMDDLLIRPTSSKEITVRLTSSKEIPVRPTSSKEIADSSANLPSETSQKNPKRPGEQSTGNLKSSEQSSPESSKQSNPESSSRKRKSSPTKDESKAKRSKSTYKIESSDEEEEHNEVRVFLNFLESDKGKDWVESGNHKEIRRALIKAKFLDSAAPETSPMCVICCVRPKNATITHGRLSHQATCYQCARRLLDTGARCPVCRRKIHMVSKNIMV